MQSTAVRRNHTSAEIGLLDKIFAELKGLEKATEESRFPESPEIATQLEAIRSAGDRVINLHAELTHMLETARKSCVHRFRNVTRHDPHYQWTEYGATLLVERICDKCTLVEHRPKGDSFHICDRCWSPMESDGVEPGQGGRFYHYKCTKCEFHVTHT